MNSRGRYEYAENGTCSRMIGVMADVTSLKQAELALLEADRRKDEFLAMLAHELRNPLAPIRNAAHVLGRLESQEPRVQWVREIIERQVDHLSRLVDDLLDVSRIVRGKVTLKRELVELASVVNQALDIARPLIEAKKHQIAVGLPEQAVHLEGDPVRLAQVLLNLLDNAVKYTPEGGRITLQASLAGQLIELKVSDNGIGIPAQLLPQVFDLFQQGERTLDRSQGGLGIGLTLAKGLVEMHGGQLEAHSAGAGEGSVFTVWLPAHSMTSAKPGADVQKASPNPTHCRVLVVDDDFAVAESMVVLLQIVGHDVRSAASGEAALELARDFRPQVVLLDIGLPDMDGYEVARQLREDQIMGETLCLMAVTGYGHENARTRSAAAGFDHHLVKPVSPDNLCDLLAEIGRSQAARTPGG
jgi:CheY-like chemotaxis protein